MCREEFVKMCQENARQYSRAVAKQRRREKCRKAALGVILSAFFITAFAIVGNNDLESEGIVLAKESETISATHTLQGKIIYRNLIETEEGYRWVYDTNYPEGTDVNVVFNNNGTVTNPIDDIVLEVTKR